MKKFKKFVTLLTLSTAISLFAPEVLPIAPMMQVDATTRKAKLNKTKLTLIKGQHCTLKVSGIKGKIKWSSSKPSIASVSSSGKVTARKKGSSTIYAKVSGKTLSCKTKVESPSLNKTSLNLTAGKTYTLKLSGNTQSVKWSSSNTSIATVTSKGKVTAKKAGSAKIYATINSKKYTCNVSIKSSIPEEGSRTNPLSAYKAYTTNIYDYGVYIGKFKIQLLDYKDGQDAYSYVMNNPENDKPSSTQEYIYVKYKISYLSGEDEVDASSVINYYSGFFNSSATYSLNNIDWGFEYDDVDDIVDVLLYPGGSAICSCAIIVKSGNTPITYRLETGYDNKKDKSTYTWFTTKK